MINKNRVYLFQIIKSSFLYSISKLIPGLAGIISVIFFFKWLGPEEYGKYSIIFSFTNLIAAFSFGWLNQSILRYGSTFNDRSQILNHIFKGFILSIISITVIVLIATTFTFPIPFPKSIIIFLAISIGLFNIFKSIFQSEELPNKVLLITGAQSILMILVSMLLVNLYNNNSISLILGISFGYIIPIIPYLFLFKKKKRAETQTKTINFFFNYGAPLSIWLALSLFLNFSDRYFIEYYYGSSLMGSYAGFSEFIIRIFSIIIFPITLAVHPMIMNNWNKNKNYTKSFKILLQASLLQILISSLMLIMLIIFKNYIFSLIQLLIPNLDKSMKEILIPIFLGGFFWQLALVVHKPLELEERTLAMVGCILVSVIINIVGNYFLLPIYGIIATAYSMIFSAVTYIILSILISKSFIRILR
jgi:O-antigen/teichoic acid export membrane protein